MALITWSEDYSVGVDVLDADHVVIISLMNHVDDAKLAGCDERAVGRLVSTLVDYACMHFEREEALMDRHGYPRLEGHREAHRVVEDQLRELHEAYQQTADPNISQEIMELLNYWLVEHILKVDMHYKPYLSPAPT